MPYDFIHYPLSIYMPYSWWPFWVLACFLCPHIGCPRLGQRYLILFGAFPFPSILYLGDLLIRHPLTWDSCRVQMVSSVMNLSHTRFHVLIWLISLQTESLQINNCHKPSSSRGATRKAWALSMWCFIMMLRTGQFAFSKEVLTCKEHLGKNDSLEMWI